jgi:hypothetical protein
LLLEALDPRIVPVSLSVSDVPVVACAGMTEQALVHVTLDRPTKGTVSVDYATADGAAKAGSDYIAASGKLIFEPGESSKDVVVPILSDTQAGKETFFVDLKNVTGAKISDGRGVITILDDRPRVQISETLLSEFVAEFTVSLSAAYDQTVKVAYATANLDNPWLAPIAPIVAGTLTFAPDETTKSFSVGVSPAPGNTNDAFVVNLSVTYADGVVVKSFDYGYVGHDNIESQDLNGCCAAPEAYGPTLSVGGPTSPIAAGQTETVTVTAFDGDGAVLTDYVDMVHFVSTDPMAELPDDYTFTIGPGGDNGVHTFTATLKSAGLQSLSVSDTAGATGSASIEVVPAAVSQLSVAGSPSPRPLGAGGALSVTATDRFGNQVPSYRGKVHFNSTDPLATVSGGFSAAMDFSATDNPNGVWSYGWSPTLGAGFVQDTSHRNNSGIDGWNGEQAGDGNPSVNHNGTASAVTLGSITWQPGQLAFHPGPNGEYSVVRWTAPRTGTLSFAAVFGGLDFVGPTSTDVHVLHNSAPLFDGEVMDFGAGPSFATTLAVLAGDTIDFSVGYGSNGTFNCDTTGLDVSISYNDSPTIADYTFTAADAGRHSFSATFGTAGLQSLTATDTATPSITGAEQNIDVISLGASNLVVSGFASPTAAGTVGRFTVTAKLADGSTAINYAGTIHFTSSDSQAGLPADYTFTSADGGVHTFSATLRTAGAQSLAARDVVSASVTGTQTGITVSPAAASRLTLAGFPSPVTAGVSGSFTVTAVDRFGNRATGYRGTIRYTSSDAQAALPANYSFTADDAGMHTFSAVLKTAGNQSVTATDTANAAVVGSQSVTVNPAAASRLRISAPDSVKAKAQFSVTAAAVDAFGNVATAYRGTLSFRRPDSTVKLPSNYTFTATDLGAHTFVGLVLKKKGKQTITVTDTLDRSLTGSVTIQVL